jgi:MinD-like ATPase involved in chromosome partitioning or flagellar assembly
MAPYRRLAWQLHYDLPRGEDVRSALLVTPSSSTLCARGGVLLSTCLAEQLRRPILLIDVCPGNPETTRIMGCTERHGFTDFLANPSLLLDELVLPTTCENVSFLPSGKAPARSQPVSHEAIDKLMKASQCRFDFVLLTGGAVLSDPLSLALAPGAGSVLLVVIENETRVDDLDAAQNALNHCKARNVGMLLTTPIRSGLWSR